MHQIESNPNKAVGLMFTLADLRLQCGNLSDKLFNFSNLIKQ